MRLLGCLLRAQCRCLARLGTTGLLLICFVAVMAQLAAGLPPAQVLSWGGITRVLAIILPEFLAVLLPLSLAHGLLGLEETGERGALSALGVRPAWVVLGTLLPLLPFVLVLHLLVHQARPAARVEGKRAAMSSEQGFWRGMESVGVGRASIGPGLHALWPAGDSVLAVTASAAVSTPRGAELRSGRVRVVTGGDIDSAEFGTARLAFDPVRVGLGHLAVADLSTRFLVSQSIRWRRARLRWHGERSGEAVASELQRRRLALPALGLSLLVVALLSLVRRRLSVAYVHGVCIPIAVGVGFGIVLVLP